MNTERRSVWVTGLLLAAWILVVGWQTEEHQRIANAAKLDLRSRSQEIANTVSAVIRAARFRSTVVQDRIQPVLEFLVNHTNALARSSDRLIAVTLLNTNGEPVVSVPSTNLYARQLPAEGEYWGSNYVTFVLPVEGASVSPEGFTNNATVVLPGPRDFNNGPGREPGAFPRHEPPPEEFNATNSPGFSPTNPPSPPADGEMIPPPGDASNHPLPPGERSRRDRGRPPWLRWMSEADYNALISTHELHGLVFTMSTDKYRITCTRDLWLRLIIAFFAGISALGAGLAWRNMNRTADLQIRLVRASELNSHLKELNLAAAGLAHETRNPLNIIRGQAQMISRLAAAPPEVREKSQTIVDETDKVTAQLTEFINYSRPREVRRTRVALTEAANEIVHTLALDIEEKKVQVEVSGEALAVEADEQLVRQVLFNLLLNAIQAVEPNGKIQVAVQRSGPTEAVLEVRDDGPGVPLENRSEIFKPYFTTHQNGTGLGLAVVQQIVLAHGWEIACLDTPRGAVFRITHLKIAG
ncbi:MAG: ATP-binding protein [Verrucomicrobiota bacterium]|jgi:signal transduction histidine kinase